MAFKGTVNRSATGRRIKVLQENRFNTRSSYDKPLFVLPKYMNDDYQASELRDLTPDEYLDSWAKYVRGFIPKGFMKKSAKENKVFDTIKFGKYKGTKLADLDDESYIAWLLYTYSWTEKKNPVLVKSLYYHNNIVRYYVENPSQYKRFGQGWVYKRSRI